ncbi:MAG: hypothetical protein PHH24_00590 [Candidatus Moranbacteria bacterium]|jgi:flagellar basal body-associated protein FliL|nr:hypothetical protein [Candidatus Moranbacteria bacterium]MDD5652207.1 hypothetical protein [Candidatus Moranbacteria bacterium]MDX9855758.1 hypothetical protein [Candidatus Moranbacteria bacterium]
MKRSQIKSLSIIISAIAIVVFVAVVLYLVMNQSSKQKNEKNEISPGSIEKQDEEIIFEKPASM